MINVTDTLISQYRNSPAIKALILAMNEKTDPRRQVSDFSREVWDLRTCGELGLTIWGLILGGVPRIFAGEVLEVEDYRSLLFLRAAANITDCSMPDLNRLLQELFKRRGVPYVVKAGTKFLRYVIPFTLTEPEREMIRTAGLIPRPAAVGYEVLEYLPDFTFGFFVDDVQEQPWRPMSFGVFAKVYYEF